MADMVTKVYHKKSLGSFVSKKTGHRVYSTEHDSSVTYQLKLHHPDAAELAAIRVELATGMTKKAVAAAHDIGTVQRLNRLLEKSIPPAMPPVRIEFTDEEIALLIEDLGL